MMKKLKEHANAENNMYFIFLKSFWIHLFPHLADEKMHLSYDYGWPFFRFEKEIILKYSATLEKLPENKILFAKVVLL